MAYRLMFPGRFISPYSNRRTDEFGGSVANRARFPLMICKKIKERCGEDFLIEISCSGHEPELTPGVRIEDTIQLAKEIEGVVDMLQIRGTFIDPSQPTYINTDRIIHRKTVAAITEGVRSMGCKTKVTIVGGCSVPELLDEIIRNGEADFIGMARGLIADANLPQKALEGRSDEIVPCLRCNKCHQAKWDDWNSVCSVNPEFGIEHRRLHMSVPPSIPKKTAVIGGGPAGMKTAIDAADRGHKVTIFEQGDRLGGLLNDASVPAIKWTLKEFRDYLIHMVEKNHNIEVKFNVKATPDIIEAGDFDAVVSAIGAAPVIPKIPGVDLPHVVTAVEALRGESKLAKEVVIVGGGEIGVETGIHLAENGHHVTVLEMLDELAPDSVPIHFRSLLRQKWEATEGFDFRLHARVIAIRADAVIYVDENGAEYTVPAESVVISVGTKSKTEEAYSFYGSAKKFYVVGDCYEPGSVQQAMRNGYATARMI
jgi:NADPH-dependent 2,4-dienoyl-CoA reductase/sulfur reductase-like enzyme